MKERIKKAWLESKPFSETWAMWSANIGMGLMSVAWMFSVDFLGSIGLGVVMAGNVVLAISFLACLIPFSRSERAAFQRRYAAERSAEVTNLLEKQAGEKWADEAREALAKARFRRKLEAAKARRLS